MNAISAIHTRTSYRGKYLDKPVSREDIKAVMEAGLAAPSGCNKQTTSLIGVDDPAVLGRLKALTHSSIGETAPAMVCVLTRKIIAYKDRTFYVQDYAAAIENMLLESCWVEGKITGEDRIGRQMADALGVPEEYELVCFLPLGYPAEDVKRVSKQAFEDRARFNGWDK